MGCLVSSEPRPLDGSNDKRKNQKELPGSLVGDSSVANKLAARFLILRQGKITDDYRLDKKLGSGAYGSVYLGIHKRAGIERAIKKIPMVNVQNPEKMLEEVELLKDLDHPNIVKVFEVVYTGREYYVVTELCKGQELFDRIIDNGFISENLAALYTWQMLSAINHCHQRGIVHRDIKPENLLFDFKEDSARLKVIDFGISKKVEHGETLSSFSGTIFYVAPEVIQGKYDSKCDIWSCGVVLYAMLSGALPFNGENDREITQKILSGTVSFDLGEWDHVSDQAKHLIRRMLTKDPKRRPSAEEVLQDEWIQNYSKYLTENKSVADSALGNLQAFRAQSKIKSSILNFIISHMSSTKDLDELTKIFQSMDTNGDGRLCKEELTTGYEALGLGNTQTVQEIMKTCDVDGSGFVDFTEFCVAAQNWENYMSKKNIEQLFKMYDQDSSGTIDLQEFKNMLGPQLGEEYTELLKEADANGDGVVDLNEFTHFIFDKLIPTNNP